MTTDTGLDVSVALAARAALRHAAAGRPDDLRKTLTGLDPAALQVLASAGDTMAAACRAMLSERGNHAGAIPVSWREAVKWRTEAIERRRAAEAAAQAGTGEPP